MPLPNVSVHVIRSQYQCQHCATTAPALASTAVSHRFRRSGIRTPDEPSDGPGQAVHPGSTRRRQLRRKPRHARSGDRRNLQ